MQYYHGISPTTGLPFSPPTAFRTHVRPNPGKHERATLREARCHQCRQWVAVEGVKDVEPKVKEIYWCVLLVLVPRADLSQAFPPLLALVSSSIRECLRTPDSCQLEYECATRRTISKPTSCSSIRHDAHAPTKVEARRGMPPRLND